MIIVSFTTSPRRLPLCRPMIDSLLNQTRKPDKIVLNLPPRFDRTGETYPPDELLPDWLTDSGIEIHRCDRDWGPSTKIVPTVIRAQEVGQRATIIIVDDDVSYPVVTVSALVDVATSDREVWCVSGYDIGKEEQYYPVLKHGQCCTIAEGYSGAAYPTRVFEPDFVPYMEEAMADADMRLHDDTMISNYLAGHGVKRRVLASPECSRRMFWRANAALRYGLQEDALHRIEGPNSNIKRMRRILTKLGAKDRLSRHLL